MSRVRHIFVIGRHCVAVSAMLAMLMSTLLSTGASAVGFPPHNESAAPAIDCLSCHLLYDSGVTNLPRDLEQETACKGCHNPSGQASTLFSVANHVVNSGTKIIDCGNCHSAHGNRHDAITDPRTTFDNDNLRLIRENPSRYEAGATLPVFYDRINQFAQSTAPYNGICNVCHTTTAHHRRDDSGGDHSHWVGQDCTVCHPHDQGFAAIGDDCGGCHLTGGDLPNWDINDGTMAEISTTEWNTYGHGAVGFTAAAPCLGCHDNTVSHHDGANPFRLANFDYGSYGWNGTCLVCHENAPAPGYNGDDVSTKFMSSHHNGDKHLTNNGGSLCWDCHDPHGDGVNIKMIATDVTINNNDAWGLSATRTVTPVVFTDNSPTGDWASQNPGPYVNLCNVCHTDNTFHYYQGDGDGHNNGSACTGCHPHQETLVNEAFKAPVGVQTCIDCHVDVADVDNWNIGDATPSKINSTEWTTVGHGSASVGFAGPVICLYCHGDDGVADHNDGTNPFRLVNNNVTGDGWNSNCLICHKTTETGFDPDAGGTDYVTATSIVKMDSAHAGAGHGAGNDGGELCWDCHDPHGDGSNIKMIGTSLIMDKGDSYGLTGTRTALDAVFTANAVGTDFAKSVGPFNGVCNVCHASTNHYTTGAGDNHFETELCTDCHSHEQPPTTGFSPGDQNCGGCHLGTGDTDNWVITDGIKTIIDTTEWSTLGHGYGAAGFAGPNTCLYCHEDYPAGTHQDGTNPFRLANTGGGQNGNCLICHDPALSGFDPDGPGTDYVNIDPTAKIESIHSGDKHPAGGNGGSLCWDCHDPHGDASNIKMIGDILMRDGSDAYGLAGARTIEPVVFISNAAGTDFAASGAPYDGVCNVCHTDATLHYQFDSGNNHNEGAGACTQGGCHTHEQVPDQAFAMPAGGGGNCLGCHGLLMQPTGSPVRRAVTADFSLQSHHVGSGGATMGGTLTNYDCVVCHAEGEVIAGPETNTTAYHKNGVIDLYDADNLTTVYSYDKDAVAASAGGVMDWRSGNAVWETQTSTALDPFCVSCHDADGATASANTTEGGGSATNPFGDTMITNDYDQADRTGMVNIEDMISGAPPVDGQFARHAIRGMSTSIYGTANANWSGATYWATDASATLWDETMVMGCADCHTTDGANGTGGNAHGSPSEYLLKDSTGTGAEGTLGGSNYGCYLCHAQGFYNDDSAHTGSGSNYVDATGSTGPARVSGNAPSLGMACMNCHGGAPGPSDTVLQGFGRIHGTSQVFDIGETGGGGSRNAYRFTNGAGLRFYDPEVWSAASYTCYTLDNSTTDAWGGCTNHNRGKADTRVIVRPLAY